MTRQPETDAPEVSPVWEPGSPAASESGESGEAGEGAAEDGATVTAQGDAAELARRRVRPAPIAPRRSDSVTVLLGISALIAIGGIGFAAGHVTGSGGSSTAQNGADAFGPNASGGPGGFGGVRPDASGVPGIGGGVASVSGTVVSVGTDSFTVKLASGETVTIATGSSTTYHNQTSGSSTDLTSGETVLVQTSVGSAASPNANAGASTGTQTVSRTATDVTIAAK